MAKKIANAKATEDIDATAPADGTPAPVNDGGAGTPSGDQGGASAPGDAGDSGIKGVAGEILGSNPASSDASAGITAEEGSSTAGAGDAAGAPAQNSDWPWEGQAIPAFLDREGKVRSLVAADVRPIPVTKNVKVDGVMLEAGTTPLMPRDVYGVLVEFGAVEEE